MLLGTKFLSVFLWSTVTVGHAQETLLISHPKEREFQAALEKGRLTVFGKSHKSADRCNEDTAMNPDALRVFSVKGANDKIVMWCPGSLDGASNWTTIFRKGKSPITWQVDPAPDKASITIEKLTAEIEAKL